MTTVQPTRSNLSAEQRQRLALRIRQAENRPDPAAIARQTKAAYPLSLSQEGLWFLHHLAPESGAYNIFGALRLHGAVNQGALEASINAVLARHDILRTNFPLREGAIAQVVRAAVSIPLIVTDFSDVPAEDRNERILAWAKRESGRPFDLSKDLLIRVHFARFHEAMHGLLLTVHHIIADGWSFGLLFSEILLHYNGLVKGRPITLSDLTIQYGDYAEWQRQSYQEQALEKSLSYWRQKLMDAPPVTNLPADRPRPARRSFEGQRYIFEFPIEIAEGLRAFTRANRVTTFAVLISAFAVLLHKYSGEKTLLIGSPFANRPNMEVEKLIGLFVTTLVLRSECGDDPSLLDYVKRMALEVIETADHRAIPFEYVINALKIPRETSYSPVFQTMFTLQPTRSLPEIEDLKIDYALGSFEGSNFDLTLYTSERQDGKIVGSLLYATDLFETATIKKLVQQFLRIVDQIISVPQQKFSALTLLSDDERRMVIEEWNSTKSSDVPAHGIHDLFSLQAEKRGADIAVVEGDRNFSYDEIERRSNQVAHYLKSKAVGAEDVIGICLERSVDFIVAVLGALKAGGVFLPLDPTYPKDRLQYMVHDAKSKVVITASRHRGLWSEVDADLICIDEASKAIASSSSARISQTVSASSLAYLVYTSGSTGRPKGVAGPHGAVVNRIWAQDKISALGPAEVVGQKTAISFVDSVYETLGPLCRGVRLVVLDDAVTRDPNRLAEEIERTGITRVILVPSFLRSLLSIPRVAKALQGLRSITVSGEAIDADLHTLITRSLPNVEIVNLYGSSEVAGDATFEILSTSDAKIAIGRPMANMQAYVLDEAGEPVPVGASGEIYLGGLGLARGYLGRPGLTAEKFVPHPYGQGERLYRTGDLGRWRSDGTLEYLGRIDHQVKLRGFRIELGEIEAALCSHADVSQAVVLVREDQPGDRRLVAYVVGEAPAEGLRNHLRSRLPDYMVPAAYVSLPALPLTPNGKIDRRALPVPPRQQAEAYLAPRTETERLLAGIWCELLNLDRVGIDQNFFDLGGHSLLLVNLHTKLSEQVPAGLDITVLFQNPTIRALSAYLHQDRTPDKKVALSQSRAQKRRTNLNRRKQPTEEATGEVP